MRSQYLVAEDPQAWKWVALALHSALQGSCVCHLTTTAVPVGSVTPRNAADWISYFEERRTNANARRPRTHLMALPDLLKAVRRPRSAGDRSNEVGVAINDMELDWLHRFHRAVRNQFVHFSPMGWSLEVSGIPGIAELISGIVREIDDMGWAFRHKADDWRKALRSDLAELGQRLEARST